MRPDTSFSDRKLTREEFADKYWMGGKKEYIYQYHTAGIEDGRDEREQFMFNNVRALHDWICEIDMRLSNVASRTFDLERGKSGEKSPKVSESRTKIILEGAKEYINSLNNMKSAVAELREEIEQLNLALEKETELLRKLG